MELEVAVESAAAERLLGDIAKRANDPDRLLGALSDDLQEYESDVFATSGHGTWAPDSPATLAQKSGGRVLVDTGGLLDELTSEGAISVLGDTLTLRSSTAYAGYLKRGARGAPPRDPVPPPESGDVRDWADHMLGFLVTGHGR